MKRLFVRVVVILLVLLVVAVGVSIYFLGSIVKKGVETVGPQITKTEIKLDSATLSLLSGSGKLKGLLVGNPEGFKTESAIKVGAVSIGIVARSVFSDKVRVTQVNVQAPVITFEGGLKGNNLSKLLDNVQAASGGSDKPKATSSDKSASKKLQVDDFLISGGKINLSIDAGPLGGKSATVPLPEIHLTNLGAGPDGITAGDLTGNQKHRRFVQEKVADRWRVGRILTTDTWPEGVFSLSSRRGEGLGRGGQFNRMPLTPPAWPKPLSPRSRSVAAGRRGEGPTFSARSLRGSGTGVPPVWGLPGLARARHPCHYARLSIPREPAGGGVETRPSRIHVVFPPSNRTKVFLFSGEWVARIPAGTRIRQARTCWPSPPRAAVSRAGLSGFHWRF